MVELSAYLISLFCVILGMMGLISALKIESWIRMSVACCAALIPVVAGIFFFWSAELSLSDLRPAFHSARKEWQLLSRGIDRVRYLPDSLEEWVK